MSLHFVSLIVCTTVEHVIMHVFCGLEGKIKGTVNDYILKVNSQVQFK